MEKPAGAGAGGEGEDEDKAMADGADEEDPEGRRKGLSLLLAKSFQTIQALKAA